MHLSDTRTRISVRHADTVVSAGLVAALQQHADFDLTSEGADGCDLVVCDYATGLQLARSRRHADRAASMARLLVLTDQDREHSVTQALQSGVHGYLLRGTQVEVLVDAVRAVSQGKTYLSPEIVQRMADSMAREALTPREMQVLEELAAGHGNKETAARLGIAPGTVKAHVRAIMAKLDVTSRTHAVSIAAQRGLVSLGRHGLH